MSLITTTGRGDRIGRAQTSRAEGRKFESQPSQRNDLYDNKPYLLQFGDTVLCCQSIIKRIIAIQSNKNGRQSASSAFRRPLRWSG